MWTKWLESKGLELPFNSLLEHPFYSLSCADLPGHHLSIILWAEFVLGNQQLRLAVIFIWGGGVWAITCKTAPSKFSQFAPPVLLHMTSAWPHVSWRLHLHWGPLLSGPCPPAAAYSWGASWCWRRSGCCPQRSCSESCPPRCVPPGSPQCTPARTQPKHI